MMLWFLWSAVLFCSLSFSAVSFAKPGSTTETPPDTEQFLAGEHSVLTSSGTAGRMSARETAGPDTFVIYGGPDHPTEGKFQMPDGQTEDWGGGNGLPGGYGGGPGAWSPVDNSFQRVYWHVNTFNAANLNSNGAGNRAMWCGLPAGDPDTAGWSNGQGYGNEWSDGLVFESELISNPEVGQIVALDGFLNYQTELDYDFVRIEYFYGGGLSTEVGSVSGTNAGPGDVFAPPGVSLASILTAPIEYQGGDYEHIGGPRIKLRIRFTSDGAWSDEDGLFLSTAGAAQVDDLTVTYSEGSSFEDFEGSGPYQWKPDEQPFYGDFADVYPLFTDLDPCRENPTPVAGFLDYNQIVRNGPGTTGRIQTGGEPYLGPSYGIPGSWATSKSGGLDHLESIDNWIVSPAIPVDLAGPADDDPALAGYTLRYDVWEDGGLSNTNFYEWELYSRMPGEQFEFTGVAMTYLGWAAGSKWHARSFDLSAGIEPGVEALQVRVGIRSICPFVFWCNPTSRPSPVFDNFTVSKYRLTGPVITARDRDLSQDGFPVNSSIDVSTQGARDSLDRPFDMAGDVNSGEAYTPGDSIVVRTTPFIAGTSVTETRMVWTLDTNPAFEDAIRTAPSRPKDDQVVAGAAGTVWSGEVIGAVPTNGSGVPIAGSWFFDLPDVDFMYPGDVLHYYIEATDSDGRTSTLPYDVSAFGSFGATSAWNRQFTVRALPSITDTAGTQPSLLVIHDFGYGPEEMPLLSSLAQLGYAEGVDFDTYTVQASVPQMGNGIGSYGAHGASAAQLSGYAAILYSMGDLFRGLTGSDTFGSSDDLATLSGWQALGGTRNIAYFGDNIATSLDALGVDGQAYLDEVMGVQWIDVDVRESIGNQTAPVVVANPSWSPGLSQSIVAYGGCLDYSQFDQIRPRVTASAGHYFTDPGGTPLIDAPIGVASVVKSSASGFNVTVPFSLSAVENVTARATGPSARSAFLGEILGMFGSSGASVPVSAPGLVPVRLSVAPNPFNPRTLVSFTGVLGQRGSVKVFNLRGELVRELQNGEFQATEFVWDGTDESGASVASGVYVVRADAGGTVQTAKVALVR